MAWGGAKVSARPRVRTANRPADRLEIEAMLEALIEQEKEKRRSPDELKSRICPDSHACSITDIILLYVSVSVLVAVFEVAAFWCRWRFEHQIEAGDTYIVGFLVLAAAFAIAFIGTTVICAMNRKAVGLKATKIRDRILSYYRDTNNARRLKEVFPRSLEADKLTNTVFMPRSPTLLKPARDIVLHEMRANYSKNQKLLDQRVRACLHLQCMSEEVSALRLCVTLQKMCRNPIILSVM